MKIKRIAVPLVGLLVAGVGYKLGVANASKAKDVFLPIQAEAKAKNKQENALSNQQKTPDNKSPKKNKSEPNHTSKKPNSNQESGSSSVNKNNSTENTNMTNPAGLNASTNNKASKNESTDNSSYLKTGLNGQNKIKQKIQAELISKGYSNFTNKDIDNIYRIVKKSKYPIEKAVNVYYY